MTTVINTSVYGCSHICYTSVYDSCHIHIHTTVVRNI